MNGSISKILDEFDDLLISDEKLTTRSGLRLSMSVLREAVSTLGSVQDRIELIEMERKTEKEQKAQNAEENKWLRRTTFGAALVAIVMLFINGAIFLVSTTPLMQAILNLNKP